LPRRIRPQISLAYLLARATDTIADTEAVPLDRRMETLALYRERILGHSTKPIPLQEFSAVDDSPTSTAERALLARIEQALALLARFEEQDQIRIRDVVSVIVSGQELDLNRFGAASNSNIAALHTDSELDDYTWRVAGCVGKFWTEMCRAHLFSGQIPDETTFVQNGIRFGKGLQLVNILRDFAVDLRKGRCYLPAELLEKTGLKPHDLLDPAVEPRMRPVYDRYVATSEDHLVAGWAYTNTIPRRLVRLRLACAWPILIGVRTLVRLRDSMALNPDIRLKITRREVRNIVALSLVAVVWAPAWERLFESARSL
jgi:farnesyl-diphosphate farnesyltransferase